MNPLKIFSLNLQTIKLHLLVESAQNSFQKNRLFRMDLMATLAVLNFSKINFKEGY